MICDTLRARRATVPGRGENLISRPVAAQLPDRVGRNSRPASSAGGRVVELPVVSRDTGELRRSAFCTSWSARTLSSLADYPLAASTLTRTRYNAPARRIASLAPRFVIRRRPFQTGPHSYAGRATKSAGSDASRQTDLTEWTSDDATARNAVCSGADGRTRTGDLLFTKQHPIPTKVLAWGQPSCTGQAFRANPWGVNRPASYTYDSFVPRRCRRRSRFLKGHCRVTHRHLRTLGPIARIETDAAEA